MEDTPTEAERAKELVDETNATLTHEDVRNIFEGDRVETIENNLTDGFYEAWLEDGSHYRVCAICGETQPMNIEAMLYEDESVVRDAMIQELKRGRQSLTSILSRGFDSDKLEERLGGWDNNRCESHHPPLQEVGDDE